MPYRIPYEFLEMEHPQDEGDMETDRGTEKSTVVEMTEVLGRIQKVADGTAIMKDHTQRNLIQGLQPSRLPISEYSVLYW